MGKMGQGNEAGQRSTEMTTAKIKTSQITHRPPVLLARLCELRLIPCPQRAVTHVRNHLHMHVMRKDANQGERININDTHPCDEHHGKEEQGKDAIPAMEIEGKEWEPLALALAGT